MSTLIFDIETVGEAWGNIDPTTQTVLTRWIDRSTATEEERIAKMTDLKAGLGFSPLTGSVVSIALYDLERQQGAVYFSAEDTTNNETVGEYVLKVRSETEMLEEFWEGARAYDTFVTFNGRAFDVPFLLHRSVATRVKPTADLLSGRYLYQQKAVRHVDLLDQLTFYGAQFRKPSLHLFCRAFGIESPKVSGVSGDDVAELFQLKKFRDIALYNRDDVVATTALYELWLEYLAPPSFLNTVIE